MQAIILYPDGQRIEVLVLSIGRYTIRVVPHNSADTVELTLSQGQWIDENGVPIEFESFIAGPDIDTRNILPQACIAAS